MNTSMDLNKQANLLGQRKKTKVNNMNKQEKINLRG